MRLEGLIVKQVSVNSSARSITYVFLIEVQEKIVTYRTSLLRVTVPLIDIRRPILSVFMALILSTLLRA